MDFENSLNEQQLKAVYTTDGPLLILAGAGSGKTRVLMYKIAYLAENGLAKPSEILAVTFTNKAAEEMKERIASMLPGKKFSWIGTFHSFCAKILRMKNDDSWPDKNFIIYDESDKKSVLKEILRSLHLDDKSDKSPSAEKFSAIISNMKNRLISPEACDRSTYEKKLIAKIYTIYQEKLRGYGALDFDDLLVCTYQMLREETPFAESLKNRFKYILVDEYQDINYAQYMLIRELARSENITVVGDDDQSIYRFRGADMSIMLKFEEDYPNANVIKLEQNYRSTSTILDAANALMTHNKVRKEKKLWTKGEVGEKISLFKAMDGRGESRFVIRKIKELIKSHGYSYKDFVIIYRTNAQSRLFEEECIREGIPYNLVGSLKFYDRKEIKDLIAYLRLIIDVKDNISLKRIINIPPRGIGSINFSRIEDFAQAQGISLYEACKAMSASGALSAKISQSLQEFTEIIDKAIEISETDGLLELLNFLIEKLAFREYLLTAYKNAEGVAKEENLNEFISVVKEFQENFENGSLSEFLSNIALISDIDVWDDEGGRVSLMTFHLTKGLEFPIAFLTGLEERFLPHFMSSNDESGIEEERRLLYVGITRAQKRLFITNADRRMERGISEQRTPSRFLKEIPSSCISSLAMSNIPNSSLKARYLSSTLPDFTNSDSGIELNKGDGVSHKVFGTGRVISVSGDAITVDFIKKGIKTVVKSFLEKV